MCSTYLVLLESIKVMMPVCLSTSFLFLLPSPACIQGLGGLATTASVF